MQIRSRMALSMKHNYTHSARLRTVDECHEFQSPPRRAIAQTERKATPQSAPENKQEPEWRNLTLAELETWLANAKREEGLAE